MADTPRFRWFQFKLSTILILTAIAAWGMGTKPWLISHSIPDPRNQTVPLIGGSSVTYTWPDEEQRILNPALQWPTLALASFLTWKAGWWITARAQAYRLKQSAPVLPA